MRSLSLSVIPLLCARPLAYGQAPHRLQVGEALPSFALHGVDGKLHASSEAKTPLLLVVFLSAECPYVRDTEDRINALAKTYRTQMATFGLNANASIYADESLRAMRGRAHAKGYAFPYLKDEDGAQAKAFGALCTPDFFLFDAQRRLAYHGRLDDAWGRPSAHRQDLEEAIKALAAGGQADAKQVPSRGCSIK